MAIVKWNRWGWPSVFEEDNWPSLSNWQEIQENPGGMDIYETDDAVVVEAQVPGIDENDVDVTVEGNIITISAKHEENKEEKDKKITIYKCTRQTSFNYSTSLPRMVDSDKANAVVQNGVVKVTIPKLEEERPKRIFVKRVG